MAKMYLVTSEDAQGNVCIVGIATSKKNADDMIDFDKRVYKQRTDHRTTPMTTNNPTQGFSYGYWKQPR